jgi:mRNA interferase RelE/StbE
MAKTVRYSPDALAALFRHRNRAEQIMAKIERFAESGAGDVKSLAGSNARRLRVGDFRVIFEESATEIVISRIGPRGGVYD